ncbi:MAG: 1-acyl-sn-glycerol-3-phosphate acyltransferase [Anaerolineae bacterium]|jgi:1-acyl-sn-glycerol-3-phosphate acyltransferase|nr:1-acyl-sn-glycerol-3-phosphate acyltransferase [Anaerolineae bacterium]MBT7191588.1 1-acyl-sn-glycerol-3-phosphate acyltransferase [Anaerolineae bacterium]MBT7324870.1 1-acyl-sn-glycerol-3-phosphate acyltransferase [Anaerolineae bacterium]
MIHLSWQHRFFTALVRFGTSILCKIDKADLAKVPDTGPLIAYANHIGSLEVPLVFSHLHPRAVTAMAKGEAWENPFYNWLFDVWKLIPVRRGEADIDAMRTSIKMTKEGYIFGISPEGTRSRDGKLIRAQPGVVPIALKTGAPLIPIAHWGVEDFPQNIKRLRRTNFHIRVGKPFTLETNGERVNSRVRQEMVDEIMVELAKLMPEEYRGAYSDIEKTPKYIRYTE